MDDSLAVAFGGETLRLLPDRALYWPARERLIIADLHLGKGDTFRSFGIALPRGGTGHDLARLDALLATTQASALWVLGDMLHGALVDTAWREAWTLFRHRHAAVDIVVIAGNHDRALFGADLDISVHRGDVVDGRFVFSHARERVASHLCVSGHRHPVVKVPGIRGRHACFDFTGAGLVLPAFSAFTGGHLLERPTGWVACVGGHLLSALAPVPPSA